MAKSLITASQLAKARSASLIKSVQPFTSLISVSNHSQLAPNEKDSNMYSVFMPTTNSYSDEITLREVDQFSNLSQINQRDHEYIMYLMQENFLRQHRQEWLRYNLAMKDCSDEIFHCSSGRENESRMSDEHAKLYEMKEYLADHLVTFFVKTHNYSIYHKDLIFENNYFEPPRTYRGINAYMLQLNKYRWLASFCFTYAKFEILKITATEADHSIRVRWRISGLSNMAAFTRFWKFFPGKYRNSIVSESDWHDGYSTFCLNKDGVIFKHIVDRVIPDDEVTMAKKTGLAAKLALALGLFLDPAIVMAIGD